MESKDQIPASLYTESTPNPETLKFVANQMLLANGSENFPDVESANSSPLAFELFGFPFVNGVFISQNFVTITKQESDIWEDIIPSLKEFITKYISEGKEIIKPKTSTDEIKGPGEEAEVVLKIKDILENRVRPAVEMDGGAIRFVSFENGTVTVQLQGACSGCPSAGVTLKAGIEALLKQTIPEVQNVVAESGI